MVSQREHAHHSPCTRQNENKAVDNERTRNCACFPPKTQLRSASMNLLDYEPYNLKGYGDRAFSVSAPRFWNSLPDHIRDSQSVEIFKTHVKTYLFSQAYPIF